MKKFLAVFLLVFQLGFSQLSDFTLSLTVTHETCQGNGSISFMSQNTTSGAIITYSVYLASNLTTPVGVTQSNSLSGLSAGSYVVIATQNLNGDSNTAQQQTVINNNINPITFTISEQNVKCENDGVLIATVTSGNPVSFELLTGPVTAPPQASNVFSGLPVGNYAIRVFDTCGNGVVNSFALTQRYTPVLLYSEIESNLTCNDVTIGVEGNFSNSELAFPLSLEITVYPPNSAPSIIFSQTITSPFPLAIEQIIPRFDGDYYYDIKVVDRCGIEIRKNHILINKDLKLTFDTFSGCVAKLQLLVENAVSNYTIDFLSAPINFNPTTSYAYHPGPYTILDPIFINAYDGVYTVRITDSCNKTVTRNVTVQNPEIPIERFVSNDGCGTISFFSNPISDIYFQSVHLISAPAGYTGTVPADLSNLIITITNAQNLTSSSWTNSGYIPGVYVFEILDSCGNRHTLTVAVPPAVAGGFYSYQYPGCELGMGSVNGNYAGSGGNIYRIGSVKVINAPSGFPFSLPYDITNFTASSFNLIEVPQGDYTIQMTNTCGNVQTNLATVIGYYENETTLNVDQLCSSFNFIFEHQGNGVSVQYGLQKLDDVTGNWVHPITGEQIINNVITGSNFYSISHNLYNNNLPYTGKFRIIKVFSKLPAGTSCVRSIKEFEVLRNPKILDYGVLNCADGQTVVSLDAIGIGQLIYRIVKKENVSFIVNNGINNVFVNLIPALYDFEVEDSCGNILTQQIQILDNIQMQVVPNLCENQVSTLAVPNYTFLQYEWWKDGSPSVILSNSNTLTFSPFNFASDGGIYYVRITHVGRPDSCLNTIISYAVSSQLDNPQAGLDNVINFCNTRTTVNLNSYLSGTFSTNGAWLEITTSSSPINNGIWNATLVPYGSYQFKYTVSGFCTATDEAIITINLNEKPVMNVLPSAYDLCSGENLVVDTGLTNANFNFQWVGPNGFSSNDEILQFANIQDNSEGMYSLLISNNGCDSDVYNFIVNVNTIPDFYIEQSCQNNIKTLTAIPINGNFNLSEIQFIWTGPNGFTSSINPIQLQGQIIGDYSLTIQNSGCEITKSTSVESLACSIPSGVSSNGDGLNDSFDLSGFDVDNLKIFNRYGREVYSKDNYEREWHGQDFNGHMLPAATYYYYVKLADGVAKTGWVYLTRD